MQPRQPMHTFLRHSSRHSLTLNHPPALLLEVDVRCGQEPSSVVGHSRQAETAGDKESIAVRYVPIAHLSEREHFNNSKNKTAD